jgi:hypothetical protein
MAETQPEVERIKLDRVLIAEIAEQEHEIHLIQQKIRNYTETEQRNYKSSIKMWWTAGKLNRKRTIARKLQRSAPSTDAKGLSSVWKCGLCSNWTCPECLKSEERRKRRARLQPRQHRNRKLIKSDTRSCPNCNEGILKLRAAPRWCTCKTPFDWNTGKIIAEIYTTHITSRRRDNHWERLHTTSSAEEKPPDS